jgi:folate-dependent phosphoribosylglycinamide formyltransferase PurN
MNTILICHSGAELTRQGFARWLSSFTNLVGIVEIREDGSRARQRIKSELRRIGLARFIFDVIPYRIYSRLFDAAADRQWDVLKLDELRSLYPDIAASTKVLVTKSPNTDEVRQFIAELSPDMMIARCKTLIKKEIFTIPADGTLVLHPGVCPEYRNAHGCFWALANNEPDKVGMTLLKIDTGIDTGPVYGYYSYPFDAASETPSVIHNRVVYDNLEALKDKLEEIHAGTAETIDTSGRKSGVWGQPWLSRYLKIKRDARSS